MKVKELLAVAQKLSNECPPDYNVSIYANGTYHALEFSLHAMSPPYRAEGAAPLKTKLPKPKTRIPSGLYEDEPPPFDPD